MSNLARTRAFLRSLETRDGTAGDYYAADVTQIEFPNQLTKAGATRDRAGLAKAMAAGLQSTADERYEVLAIVETGDTVALEANWSARLCVPFGALPAGATMRAHLAMFLVWRDGKIVAQRNYDCFEPFEG